MREARSERIPQVSQQADTPIEDLAKWNRHRQVADAIRAETDHFGCSQLIGLMAAADGDLIDPGLGQPCEKCLAIWAKTKGRRP